MGRQFGHEDRSCLLIHTTALPLAPSGGHYPQAIRRTWPAVHCSSGDGGPPNRWESEGGLSSSHSHPFKIDVWEKKGGKPDFLALCVKSLFLSNSRRPAKRLGGPALEAGSLVPGRRARTCFSEASRTYFGYSCPRPVVDLPWPSLFPFTLPRLEALHALVDHHLKYIVEWNANRQGHSEQLVQEETSGGYISQSHVPSRPGGRSPMMATLGYSASVPIKRATKAIQIMQGHSEAALRGLLCRPHAILCGMRLCVPWPRNTPETHPSRHSLSRPGHRHVARRCTVLLFLASNSCSSERADVLGNPPPTNPPPPPSQSRSDGKVTPCGIAHHPPYCLSRSEPPAKRMNQTSVAGFFQPRASASPSSSSSSCSGG